MTKNKLAVHLIMSTAFLLMPLPVLAGVVITEVMYDLEGTDTGREWIEIRNDGSEIDIADYKFVDSANHILNVPPKNGGKGSTILATGEVAILAADAAVFLSEYSGGSYSVIDTVMSLNNTGGTISIIDSAGAVIDQVSYTKDSGAAGDGNSLHIVGSVVKSGIASPGTVTGESENSASTYSKKEEDDDVENVEETEVKSSGFSVSAGGNRTVMAGAESVFNAKVTGVSESRLKMPKYIWNFGDGDIQRGRTVMHTYYYPGSYAVHLTSYIGNQEDTDVITVNAIQSPVTIKEVERGSGGYIVIRNDSSSDLDMSLWHLRSGDKYWSIPSGTYILKKTELKFAVRRTGLIVEPHEDVSLIFPNGEVAATYIGSEINTESDEVVYPLATTRSSRSSNYSSIGLQDYEITANEANKDVEKPSAITLTIADGTKDAEASASNSTLSNSDFELKGLLKWLIFLFGFIGLTIFAIFYLLKPEKNTVGKEEKKEEYDPDEFEIEEELL